MPLCSGQPYNSTLCRKEQPNPWAGARKLRFGSELLQSWKDSDLALQYRFPFLLLLLVGSVTIFKPENH